MFLMRSIQFFCQKRGHFFRPLSAPARMLQDVRLGSLFGSEAIMKGTAVTALSLPPSSPFEYTRVKVDGTVTTYWFIYALY